MRPYFTAYRGDSIAESQGGLWIPRGGSDFQFSALGRWKGEQVGIEPQSCDDTDMVAHRSEEFDRRKRAVGDQDNIAIGEPATDLQGGLAPPIEQRLGEATFPPPRAARARGLLPGADGDLAFSKSR